MKMYFCNCDNFGDQLNKYIFEKCFDINIEYSNLKNAKLIGIGSILHNCLMRNCDIIPYYINKWLKNNNDIYVLGSGFGIDNEYYLNKRKYIKPLRLKKNLKITGVRGLKTKTQLESILEKSLEDVIIGDLGLLADKLLDKLPDKKYSIGICPHYLDFRNPVFEKILKENPNSIILNTKDEPLSFLKKLAECRTIISTGLHPLIAADALGIPNLWGRISETTTIYKYKDYYSVFNLDLEPYNLLNTKIDEHYIYENYKLNKEQICEIKNNLINRYNNFFKTFED